MKLNAKLIGRFTLLLSFFLLTLGTGGCNFNKLFYYPDTNLVAADPEGEDIWLEWDEGDTFHGQFFGHKDPIASIYFLHGNAGNLSGWSIFSKKIAKQGYNVFAIDYPGFGNSESTPRHNRVIKSAQKGLEYFVEREDVKDTKKILLGMSLGGNLSVKIATDNQEKLDALVIEGAFTNHRTVGLTRIAKPLHPIAIPGIHAKIKAQKLIKKWKKPLLVVHSEEDVTCQYFMGKQLYDNARTPDKELWTIKGKHLRGFTLHPDEYYAKLKKIVD